jgi:L-lactate dehydrogenase complex protein LldF
MKIPLPNIMRHWRELSFERKIGPVPQRAGLALWSWFARRAAFYRLATRVAAGALRFLGRRRGRFTRLPLAQGWTAGRDLPAPEGKTFHDLWRARERARRG